MNEKWKKKRTTHYDVFEQLMTPLERHIVYKDDYNEGIAYAKDALDQFAKQFKRKARKPPQSSNQPG